MPNLLNTCETCAELQYSSCCDITIPGGSGLEAFTAYWWKVTDGQGNIWQQQATTDLDGALIIAKDSFPDGMFTPGIGTLTISVTAFKDDLTPLTLTLGEGYDADEYTCIQVTFKQTVGDSECEQESEEEVLPVLPDDALIYMNTDNSQPVLTTWSAAIIENDLPKLQNAQLIAWSALLGFQNYHGTMHLHQQDLDGMKTFTDAVGAVLDVFFSARLYNTTTDVDTYVDTCDPEFFQIDGEVEKWIPIDDYKQMCAEIIARLDGTGIRVIIWTELAYKVAPLSMAYGAGIVTIPGAENGAQYFHISDLCDFTEDQDANLVQLEQYFSSTPRTVKNEFNLLGQYNTFFSRYTNVSKLACVQFHPEDAGISEFISNKPLAHWAIGRMLKFVFEHTDKISYLCWMAWGNLFQHNQRTQEYFSCQLYSRCFTYANTFTVDFAIEGIEGVGFHDGAGNYALCITNKSKTAHVMTAEQLGAASGVTVQGDFARKTGWAESWDDDEVFETVTEANLTIRECSGSLIEFGAS